MVNNPLVSAILPVFNGDPYVVEAIESVLSQEYRPIELIVIDDGSSDNSLNELNRFRGKIRCFHQENQGTASARNRGVKEAAGDFLAFIDQDDVWYENKISLQIQPFLQDTHLEMVLSHLELIYTPSAAPFRGRSTSPHSMPGYTPSAMLIKETAFLKVGLFNTRWILGEWFDWYLRSIERGLSILMLPEILLQRRIHRSNKGLMHKDKKNEYVYIIKNFLDQQRTKAVMRG